MATRLGVDVGGTFTDLIFYDDESGQVRLAKEPTTPSAPEEGVATAVTTAVPPELLRPARYFLHGTTVGLNSLLERRGAVVGLLATRGFRDILEVRRGDRDDPYDLFSKAPPPLVPRRLRLPVTERMRADGTVETPFHEADVEQALRVFRDEGVTSVAVAFLHAYANPDHELAAERALRRLGFEGEVSLSHRVSGEYREYERTCTTVIDAYVRPRMSSYLGRLEARLGAAGFSGEPLVTRSGGGAMPFSEARQRPFETIMSGPVAGAQGAAELARTLDMGDTITADVGGTSFDTCLITNGRPQTMYEGRVVGLPVQTAWVDVRSIGAGGGSIAYVDVGGLLRVGPQSAGAEPGPACYGRGGTQPTVTDAAFVLGMLGEGCLASGLRLHEDQARAALAPLATRLGFSVDQLARGIITIANANMANAMREITVEQGQDPRQTTLLAFGGAGPLFATLLARELEIRRLVVPAYAGNFSAWGLLGADLTHSVARTRIMRLDERALADVNPVFDELFAVLSGRAGMGGDGTSGPIREVSLDMRYAGQEHTINVAVPATDGGRLDAGAPEVHRLFTQQYGTTFGHTMDEEVEIVALRALVRTPLPRRSTEQRTPGSGAGGIATKDAYSFARGERMKFQLLSRDALATEATVAGPAIILEDTATTYLDAGFEACVDPSGALFLTDVERGA